jgi:hypothetical protein
MREEGGTEGEEDLVGSVMARDHESASAAVLGEDEKRGGKEGEEEP